MLHGPCSPTACMGVCGLPTWATEGQYQMRSIVYTGHASSSRPPGLRLSSFSSKGAHKSSTDSQLQLKTNSRRMQRDGSDADAGGENLGSGEGDQPQVPLSPGDLIGSAADARLIRQWMLDPTTGPFPAGGSLFGPCPGHQSGPARSTSSGSTCPDGAEQYSTGPSTGMPTCPNFGSAGLGSMPDYTPADACT